MNILKFHLPTFCLWFVLTISYMAFKHFSGHSIWHIFWHIIWHLIPTFYLAYTLTFDLAWTVTFHLPYVLTYVCIYMYTHVYIFQQICGHFSWHCDMTFYRAGPRAASWHWCKAVAGDHGRFTKETSQTNFGTALSKRDVNISDRKRSQGHSASFWVQRNHNWLKTTISIHFSDHLRSKQLAWRRAELASQASNPTRNGRCPAGRREWDAVSTWSGCGNRRWWSRDDPWSCRGWGWANC